MNNIFIGIALILISGSGAYTTYSALTEKNEVWWFRLIELVFSSVFFILAVFIGSFFR